MLQYLVRRVLLMIPTLFVISVISYIIIELPPGDFLSDYIVRLDEFGTMNEEIVESLRMRYGLDDPLYTRYAKWILNFIRGDFGFSLAHRQPVRVIIGERLVLTIVVSLASLLFAWAIAIPIGIYSAVHQYSAGDYVFTFFGFLGLAIPNFMLALILMYISYAVFGSSVGGLFSPEYLTAPWSFGKVIDLLKNLWIPMIVVGTAGTASMIRILRANLLDELRKTYVTAARVKGLPERRLRIKYPIRMAINPIVSTIGWILPRLISGATITSVVLGLPTAGPIFLQALQQQDMYLAGSYVMILATLTVVGTLISDILLAVVDPRIRYD